MFLNIPQVSLVCIFEFQADGQEDDSDLSENEANLPVQPIVIAKVRKKVDTHLLKRICMDSC